MSDIFQEIEEDIRREKLDKVWENYGSWIMICAGVIVIGVTAYLWFGEATERRNAAVSDQYLAANELLAKGDSEGGIAALEEIIAKSSGGYVVLSGLQKAARLAADGNTEEAVRTYDAVRSSNKTDDILGQLAAIKAAWLVVETESADAMTGRLDDIAFAQVEGPWAASATEILAYSAMRAGDLEKAVSLYTKARSMPSTTNGIAGRSAEMLSIIEPQIVPLEVPVEKTGEPSTTPAGE